MLYKEILLVDDDADDTEIFIEALNSLKKDISYNTALNPVTALEELKTAEKLPDLIFVDFNMPLLNGFEFIGQMKNIEKLQNIEIILISTPAEEFMRPQFTKYEKVKYIAKPTSFDELKSLLSQFF